MDIIRNFDKTLCYFSPIINKRYTFISQACKHRETLLKHSQKNYCLSNKMKNFRCLDKQFKLYESSKKTELNFFESFGQFIYMFVDFKHFSNNSNILQQQYPNVQMLSIIWNNSYDLAYLKVISTYKKLGLLVIAIIKLLKQIANFTICTNSML